MKRYSSIDLSDIDFSLADGSESPRAGRLHVSLSDDTIVSYDVSGHHGAAIAATRATFAAKRLGSPFGIAFDATGKLYAANLGNDTISMFDSAGGHLGDLRARLSSPAGLAFDVRGHLYATNLGDSTISKFDAAGRVVSEIAWNLCSPVGLAVDGSGFLYASNHNDKSISRFDATGVYRGDFAAKRNRRFGLAFDAAGNLYAANVIGNSISKFNAAGACSGLIRSNLCHPFGVAIDPSGNLYAANFGDRTISVFDGSGNFITAWSTGKASPRFLAFRPGITSGTSIDAFGSKAMGHLRNIARPAAAETSRTWRNDDFRRSRGVPCG